MNCRAARMQFSGYLDGAVSGRVMRLLAEHLSDCAECDREFEDMRTGQRMLRTLGTAKAPADLALRIRVAVSQEKSRNTAWGLARLQSKWDNAIAPFLLQVGAGLVSAVLLLGAMMYGVGVAAAPAVLANDEPLQFHTSPRLMYVPAGNDLDSAKLDDVVVQAAVNSRGEVYDFHIVAGPDTTEVREAVAGRLLLSVFEPARTFGMPVRGQAIVSFAGTDVTI